MLEFLKTRVYRIPFADFVIGSIRQELASRYTGSLLGRLWIILQPLTMILIYTLVFSRIMHSRLPGMDNDFAYSVFLCAGLLPWGFFSDTLGRCQSVFTDNAHLLKKRAFPKSCLVQIAAGVCSFSFAVIFSLYLLFLILSGLFPGWSILLILPVLVLQTLLAVGLGLAVGIIHVFFRDAGQLVGLGLQLGFWFTPIVYPPSILPNWVHHVIFVFNPMAGIVNWYQAVFLQSALPSFLTLLPACIFTLLAILSARWLLLRRGDEIVDLL